MKPNAILPRTAGTAAGAVGSAGRGLQTDGPLITDSRQCAAGGPRTTRDPAWLRTTRRDIPCGVVPRHGPGHLPADRPRAKQMEQLGEAARRELAGRAAGNAHDDRGADRVVRRLRDPVLGVRRGTRMAADRAPRHRPGARPRRRRRPHLLDGHTQQHPLIYPYVVRANLQNPAALLADAAMSSLIDWQKPTCVLLASVLHFVPAADVAAVVAGFTRPLAPGSYLIISVGTTTSSELAAAFKAAYTAAPLHNHDEASIRSWLDGLKLAEPGLTDVRSWRPDLAAAGRPAPVRHADGAPPTAGPAVILGAVAGKPGSLAEEASRR